MSNKIILHSQSESSCILTEYILGYGFDLTTLSVTYPVFTGPPNIYPYNNSIVGNNSSIKILGDYNSNSIDIGKNFSLSLIPHTVLSKSFTSQKTVSFKIYDPTKHTTRLMEFRSDRMLTSTAEDLISNTDVFLDQYGNYFVERIIFGTIKLPIYVTITFRSNKDCNEARKMIRNNDIIYGETGYINNIKILSFDSTPSIILGEKIGSINDCYKQSTYSFTQYG